MGVQWEVTGLCVESGQRSGAQREGSLVGGPRPLSLGMAVAGQERAGRTLDPSVPRRAFRRGGGAVGEAPRRLSVSPTLLQQG